MSSFPIDHQEPISFLSDIHSGSAGETIQLLSDLSLTDKTVQAIVVNPNGLRYVVNATVSSDGSYAYLTTTATTFPYPGSYSLMPQIVNEDMSVTNADVITLNVVASI